MRHILIILIFSACGIICPAQDNKSQNHKIFNVDFRLKQPVTTPYSGCILLKKPLFKTHNNVSYTTFMKEEKLPSLRQVSIKYTPKIYEPTLIESIGSLIYEIADDMVHPYRP